MKISDIIGRRRRRPVSPLSISAPALQALPRVLIATPVKNGKKYLPRYFDLLAGLDYGRDRLSLGMLESDSDDGTWDALEGHAAALRSRYRAVTLVKHDYGFRPPPPRHAPAIQRRRREIIARARNRLLNGCLRDEDWVLWLDVDLIDYSPTLLRELLAAARNIVTPHCVTPDGATFDLNSFVFDSRDGDPEDAAFLVDGIFQPPKGAGRRYLDAFADQALLRVDAVGGTTLLVRADLHREGLCFPPFSYRGYIETEGLAMMARDMGEESWALPRLIVTHAEV